MIKQLAASRFPVSTVSAEERCSWSSQTHPHTHQVIDFSLPPLQGCLTVATGSLLVRLVLRLTTDCVTTLETFSCWRGGVSSPSMYSTVYFQQVLRRLPTSDPESVASPPPPLDHCLTLFFFLFFSTTLQLLSPVGSRPAGEFRCQSQESLRDKTDRPTAPPPFCRTGE